MPRYPYFCTKCELEFEVIKSIKDYDSEESCIQCSKVSNRRIGLVNFNGASDWKPEYNPALGCVVKSKSHQREILSRYKGEGRELIEVGNEPVENIHKYYDNQRAEVSNKRWNESSEKILHETFK